MRRWRILAVFRDNLHQHSAVILIFHYPYVAGTHPVNGRVGNAHFHQPAHPLLELVAFLEPWPDLLWRSGDLNRMMHMSRVFPLSQDEQSQYGKDQQHSQNDANPLQPLHTNFLQVKPKSELAGTIKSSSQTYDAGPHPTAIHSANPPDDAAAAAVQIAR